MDLKSTAWMRGGSMSRYPWRDTSEDIAKQSDSQWETPAGAQEKADKALADANKYTDEQNQNFNEHIENTVIHVTQLDKDHWNGHIQDNVRHVTSTEHTKLTNIQEGAEVNQNAFAVIKSPGRTDVNAKLKQDSLNLAGGTGIAITTNETTNTVTFSATGEALPGAHGQSHNIHDGTDPIPDLVQLRGDFDNLVPSTIGAETPLGAQAKADAAQTAAEQSAQTLVDGLQTNLDTHTATQVHAGEAHGLRVTDGTLEWFNGAQWVAVKSGISSTTSDMSYYVDGSNGSDANNGLSETTPFKTISKALSLLPQVINHAVRINIKAGDYAEKIEIKGIMGGGSLSIYGRWNADTTKAKIDSVRIDGCSISYIAIWDFEFTGLTSNFMFHVSDSSRVNLYNPTTTSSKSRGVYATGNSLVNVFGATISNKSTAIAATGGARIVSNGNSGSGNAVGLAADLAGEIVKVGAQPSGTTAESKSDGGVIRS